MATLPPFTVFDLETTGLDPLKGEKIIEIAGVRIEDRIIREDQSFVRLINPERPIPWEAKQIHKISDEDVAHAATIDIVLPQFLDFAKGSVLIAHNASFDMGFLKVEKECCWGYIDLPECLCTMRLSQTLFPHEFRHSLEIVAHRLNLDIPPERHRALPDVLVTAKAFLTMIRQREIRSFEELRQKAGFLTPVSGRKG